MTENSKKDFFKSEVIGSPVNFFSPSGRQFSITRQKVENAKNESIVIKSIKIDNTGIPYGKPSSLWISSIDLDDVLKAISRLNKK